MVMEALSNVINLVFTKKNLNRMNGILWSIFRAALMAGLCVVLLYPLLFTISISVRQNVDLYDSGIIWIPKHFTLDNFRVAFEQMEYLSSFITTLKVNIVSSLIQVLVCSLVGYGFARFKFKGKELLFALVLFTIIVPPETIIIPTYFNFRYFDFFGLGTLVGKLMGHTLQINLINNLLVFYLPAIFGSGIRSGIMIYVFRQFFSNMPQDLEDAAFIDGCGPLKTFIKVMAPNAGAAYLSVLLFSIVWYWIDVLYTSMYLPNSPTIMVQLMNLSSKLGFLTAYIEKVSPIEIVTRLQAGALLAILPPIILYVFLQKYFVQSIERTGIVG